MATTEEEKKVVIDLFERGVKVSFSFPIVGVGVGVFFWLLYPFYSSIMPGFFLNCIYLFDSVKSGSTS